MCEAATLLRFVNAKTHPANREYPVIGLRTPVQEAPHAFHAFRKASRPGVRWCRTAITQEEAYLRKDEPWRIR